MSLFLLFPCNLGSIHGHFIRFCGKLFVRRNANQGMLLCAVATPKSLPHQRAVNRFTVKALNSFRPGESLNTSPHHGYCDVFFFLCENFLKVFRSWQSDMRSRNSMTTCLVGIKHFFIISHHTLIQLDNSNNAHAQSVDYLRVGRSMLCHTILITRIP